MKTTYKLLLSIAVLATSLFSSCELYNPAEPIPAYIHIKKFTLTTKTDGSEGSNSHKITDAWVYVDDQIIGCFELPVTFPVISEGTHRVKIIPGIKVNGIAANRGQYPFYTSHEQDVDFQEGKTITLSPAVTYKSTADFEYLENFETAGTTISITSQCDTTIEIHSGSNVFEGTKCLAGYVDPTRFRFECATTNAFDLPTGGAPVFLEFNYKCNYEMVVSVIAQGTTSINQFPALFLNPSTNWNKAYVYLTPTVSGAYTANDYKIVWGIRNLAGVDSAAVFLDNIKLIH